MKKTNTITRAKLLTLKPGEQTLIRCAHRDSARIQARALTAAKFTKNFFVPVTTRKTALGVLVIRLPGKVITKQVA